MPPPRALKRSSWEKRAAGLFFDAAAEHVYTTSPCLVTLWGRGKHDPSRHLSPDRRTRMGRRKISTMPPITLKVRRNRRDKSSWYFYRRKWCQVLTRVKFCHCRRQITYEPSLEIQKYRLQSGRIWEMVKNFRRIHTIACRRQKEKLGGWEILGRCCLRRMRCGRIFGHMRFEALGSRSFPVVDAYSSWTRIYHIAVGGGYITFLVLLEWKLSTSRLVQNRQNSIKIHLKSFKIDKNPLQTA